jgi:hypothetical protein
MISRKAKLLLTAGLVGGTALFAGGTLAGPHGGMGGGGMGAAG